MGSRHRQTPPPPRGLRRLQIQKYPAYTLSASGLSSNHQEVVLAKQLSLIRSPDALKLCEICGLAVRLRQKTAWARSSACRTAARCLRSPQPTIQAGREELTNRHLSRRRVLSGAVAFST